LILADGTRSYLINGRAVVMVVVRPFFCPSQMYYGCEIGPRLI